MAEENYLYLSTQKKFSFLVRYFLSIFPLFTLLLLASPQRAMHSQTVEHGGVGYVALEEIKLFKGNCSELLTDYIASEYPSRSQNILFLTLR